MDEIDEMCYIYSALEGEWYDVDSNRFRSAINGTLDLWVAGAVNTQKSSTPLVVTGGW